MKNISSKEKKTNTDAEEGLLIFKIFVVVVIVWRNAFPMLGSV